MRQVDEAELIWRVRYELGQMSPCLRRDLGAAQADRRKLGELLLAEQIVRRAMHRYEILSSAPLPDQRDLFSTPAFRPRIDAEGTKDG